MWPIELPYGLSHYHRHAQMTGKASALPYGERPRWQALTLQQLTSGTLAAPSTSSAIRNSDPHRSSGREAQGKLRRRRERTSSSLTMGVVRSESRRPKAANATAQKRRNKTPKLRSRCINTAGDLVKTAASNRGKIARRESYEPGTQTGAHHDSPITIDSDDDGGLAITSEVSVSAKMRAYGSPAVPAGSFDLPVYAATKTNSRHRSGPVSSPSEPQNSTEFQEAPLRRSLYGHRKQPQTFEERLISIEPQTLSNLAKSRMAHERARAFPDRSVGARPRQTHSLRSRHSPSLKASTTSTTCADTPVSRSRRSSSYSSYADGEIEFTLANIKSLDLRRKTAQLMAVGPQLPVADLYYLLMENKGHFETAKEDVLRTSSALVDSASPLRRILPPEAATASLTTPVDHQQDETHGEPLVKIDLDDPAFMFDHEAPVTPPPRSGKRRQQRQPKPKKSTRKMSATSTRQATKPHFEVRSSQAGVHNFPSSSSSRLCEVRSATSDKRPQTPTHLEKPLQSYAATNSTWKKSGVVNHYLRETSYDRSFIVSDDEVFEDSDGTYADSATSDIDITDDEADLLLEVVWE
ncbi:hypothetical protein C7974DRAFT_424475 [Boeremia exigua]|uniref:uncharacterized protein n=1 Tax=Boeremia exigua TaxID=749465 RepID=UPI001E8CA04B|nr:uncharacterized protein C7974DRAFT_424475 [Boeremia exigua]KAH6629435.1 hypothetical protein C7974DRAFT_424475 [Boeremia exigua]